MIFRQYKKEDKEEVWSLHNIALNAVGAHGGNGIWDQDLHAIEDVYIKNNGAFVVGYLGSQLVAMGALKRVDQDTAEVKRMRVHPEFQRQGYGRQTFIHLQAMAVSRGYKYLILDTTTKQIAAQHFYKSFGFVETGRNFVGQFEVILYKKSIS